MRRQYFVRCSILAGCLLIVVAAIVLAMLAILPPQVGPGVTKANFDRLEIGMKEAEVTAIIGTIAVANDGSWALLLFNDGCLTHKEWHQASIGDTFRHVIHWPWW